ncbi:MAG: hypothetical protein AAF152_10185 [Cyanobacteria bacterium P01_A01_bin.114]
MSYQPLFAKIQNELSKMDVAVQQNREFLNILQTINCDSTAYQGILGGIAMNLQSFYTGAERIFTAVAKGIDGSRPQGEKWHQDLLDQMSVEIPDVRPALIQADTLVDLDKLLGFRHFVQNAYSYTLEPDKVLENAKIVSQCFVRLTRDYRNLQMSLMDK